MERKPITVSIDFNEEMLATIAQALGIAEQSFTKLQKHAMELATVRGIADEDKTKQVQHALEYHKASCDFADLCIKFKGIYDNITFLNKSIANNAIVVPDPPEFEEVIKNCYFCGNTGLWTAIVKGIPYKEAPGVDWCEFCTLPDDIVTKDIERHE